MKRFVVTTISSCIGLVFLSMLAAPAWSQDEFIELHDTQNYGNTEESFTQDFSGLVRRRNRKRGCGS